MSVASEVRRVEVDEVALPSHDYADAFEVAWADADVEEPRQWVLRGMGGAPAWVRWVVRRIGFTGWSVVESNRDLVRLEQRLPALAVSVVGRNFPGRRRMTTALTYLRPVLGRLLWAAIGSSHRRVAKRVVTSRPPVALTPAAGERP